MDGDVKTRREQLSKRRQQAKFERERQELAAEVKAKRRPVMIDGLTAAEREWRDRVIAKNVLMGLQN